MIIALGEPVNNERRCLIAAQRARYNNSGVARRELKGKKDAHVSTERDFVVSQSALRVCVTERDVTDNERVVGDRRLETLEPVPC